jgi:2,4-dienoyl-CoA reductase-like NADH-dependent reductase (Old Yellow Enzyme family)
VLCRGLLAELDMLGLAYLHIMHNGNEPLLADIRKLWKGTLILNRPGRPREQVGVDVASGLADLETHGTMVLANPDFVERLKTKAAMNEAHQKGFFGGTDKFYTDYPTLGETKGA